jgi:hypothetical protein
MGGVERCPGGRIAGKVPTILLRYLRRILIFRVKVTTIRSGSLPILNIG